VDPGVVTSDIFSLYFKLRDMIKEYRSFLGEGYNFSVCEYFTPYVFEWISQTYHKTTEWAKQAIDAEQWRPLATKLHSSSAIDIFCACTQAQQFLQKLEWENKEMQLAFMNKFCEVISKVVEEYVIMIEEKFVLFLSPLQVEPEAPDSARGKSRKSAVHLVAKVEVQPGDVTPMEQLCVCLNNVEAARQQLDELCTSMETAIEDVGRNFTETFQLISKTVDKLLDMIMDTKEITTSIDNEFLNIIFYRTEESVDIAIQGCLSYLDKQLEFFGSNLYEGMFKKAIKAIWRMIMELVNSLFYPQKGRVLQVDRVRVLINLLVEFFYAGGEGITKSYMTGVDRYKQIERYFSLNTLSSEELCRIHTLMAESGDESIPPAIVLFMLQGRNDPKAKSYTNGNDDVPSPKADKPKTRFSIFNLRKKKDKDKN